MIDIFANDIIYGSSLEPVGKPRKLNKAELSHLNTGCPGVVFQGKYGLSVKLFAKGSTTQFYCKSLDTYSTATLGQTFDIKKCLYTEFKRPDKATTVEKILVLDDAIIN